MKTKGMVLRAVCALPLACCSGLSHAAEVLQPFDLLEEAEAIDAAPFIIDDNVQPAAHLRDVRPIKDAFWYAGTEFTFLDVDAETGGRITLSFNDSDTAGVDFSSDDGGVGHDDLGYAPRLWLGRQWGRWGVVGRYWNLSDHEAGPPILTPGTTPLTHFATITRTSSVEMYTADLEGTFSVNPGKWKLESSVGARHIDMSVFSGIDAFGVFTTGNFVNMALSNGSGFEGTGVTSSLTVRRQLDESYAHLFFSGRGSQIDGFSDSFGRAVGTVANSPDLPLVGAATVTRNHSEADVTIAEFQAGVQFDVPLELFPASAFFRTAFEYQNWNLTGKPTGGAGFGGTIADLTTNSFASAGLGDVHLYGLALAAGFTW